MSDELFSQEELSVFQGHMQRALDLATQSQTKGVSHVEKSFCISTALNPFIVTNLSIMILEEVNKF